MRKLLFIAPLALFFFACSNDNATQKKDVDNDMFGSSATAEKDEDYKSPLQLEDIHIKLTPYVAESETTKDASRLLRDRLNSAIVKVGFGGEGSNPRFIIGPSISMLSQNITSTAPTLYSNTYEINFMVVDVVTQTIFNSYTVEFKGVGASPEKAFINGFRKVKLEDQGFFDFLKKSEEKIISFFDENCTSFIQQSDAEAGMRNFDNAYAIISSIPIECKSCFEKIKDKKLKYFQGSLNLQCNELLMSMRAELGKYNDPSASGFNAEAMSYYAMIDRQSSCYKEAQSVYTNYIRKLKPQQKRDWEFRVKKYEDNLSLIVMKRDNENQKSADDKAFRVKMSEIESRTEVEGNKKLLAKYKYDESPWLVRLFASFGKLFQGEMKTK
jgi:hypothetical protein